MRKIFLVRLSISSESHASVAKRIYFVEEFYFVVDVTLFWMLDSRVEVMLLAGDGPRKLGETSIVFRPTEIEFLDLVEPPDEGRDLVILYLWHTRQSMLSYGKIGMFMAWPDRDNV